MGLRWVINSTLDMLSDKSQTTILECKMITSWFFERLIFYKNATFAYIFFPKISTKYIVEVSYETVKYRQNWWDNVGLSWHEPYWKTSQQIYIFAFWYSLQSFLWKFQCFFWPQNWNYFGKLVEQFSTNRTTICDWLAAQA